MFSDPLGSNANLENLLRLAWQRLGGNVPVLSWNE